MAWEEEVRAESNVPIYQIFFRGERAELAAETKKLDERTSSERVGEAEETESETNNSTDRGRPTERCR